MIEKMILVHCTVRWNVKFTGQVVNFNQKFLKKFKVELNFEF